ncbi:MAG: recombination protein RecR [Phycisphaerales bacterium]|nr:recombination protein RecR [Phycisphaerales bacterium]
MVRLVEAFVQLPGIGRRSAERLAFWVLKASPEEAEALAQAIQVVKRTVRHCDICWNLADATPCPICADPRRDGGTVLVVEQPKDVLSLEQTAMFRGVFHVLMGRIDPLSGIGPESLTINDLVARVRDPGKNAGGVPIHEVILGLNPDMEGDSTALIVAERLALDKVRVTRLARGLPSGSQIEFANRAALADAIALRQDL